IGASSMYAWQFAQALGIAERHGWPRFVSMQNFVNLLYREEEREMLPLRKVVEKVAEIAAKRGIPRAQVALAWLLSKPVITAPIVGATKLQHIDDAVA